MKTEYFECPECTSPRLTVTEEQMLMLDTLEHYCFTVKAGDDNAKVYCLDCAWSGLRFELTDEETFYAI